MSDNLEVRLVNSAAEIRAADWEACFPPPLEGQFWYLALEEAQLEDQFQFRYLLLHRDSRIVGIAPCFLHDVPIALVAPPIVAWILHGLSRLHRGLGYQRTLFVGSPCSDEGTIGLATGESLSAALPLVRRLVDQLARELKAPMVVFKDFPADILAASGQLDGFCMALSYPGTIVSLPGTDKEAYYRSLTQSHRHNYLKKLRRSRDLLPLSVQALHGPDDGVLVEINDLFQQTYEKGRTKFERLGLAFFKAIRSKQEARFILLRDNEGRLVAFMLVFVLDRRLVNKFIGLDYNRDPRTSLYFRLFDAAVDFAYVQGACELQSGQTGYRAKLDLGHQLVPLYNAFRHANPAVHALFSAIGGRVDWPSLDPDLANWLKAHPEDACPPPRHR